LAARGVEEAWRRSIAEALAVIDLLDARIAPLDAELRPRGQNAAAERAANASNGSHPGRRSVGLRCVRAGLQLAAAPLSPERPDRGMSPRPRGAHRSASSLGAKPRAFPRTVCEHARGPLKIMVSQVRVEVSPWAGDCRFRRVASV
jgi:hypothetical protein